MNYRPQSYRDNQGQRWLFSYADMVTILLILFIAISAHDLNRVEARPTPPPEPKPPVSAPVEPGRDLLQAQRILEQGGLNPKLEARGLVVSLPQAVLFPSGEDRVSPSALPVLGQVAQAIQGIPNRVTLIGHADAVPIHNRRFRDNWELSMARSLSLLEALREQYGIPESRLSVAGYSSYRPQQPNDSEENRARNRRVEIVILHETAQ
jgi:chemotaxis protein MotB